MAETKAPPSADPAVTGKPLVGLAVLIYHTGGPAGLEQPYAGVVTGTYENPKLVDLASFHQRSSQFPATHPIQGAAFCTTTEELEKAAGGGNKWVCHPSDPTNPQPYVKPPNKEAPKRR